MLREVNEQGIHVLGTHCMMIFNVRNGIHTEHQRVISHIKVLSAFIATE